MARAKRKNRTGVVVSTKMQKTVIVEVERTYRHPFYRKVIRATKRFKVHDEDNKCNVGDQVAIMETKPISRDKRWRIVSILGKAKIRIHTLPKKPVKADAEQGAEAKQ